MIRDSQAEDATVVDFRNQRKGDYVRGLRLRDIHTRNAAHLLMVSGNVEATMENVVNENMTGEPVWQQNGCQDTVSCRELGSKTC